MGSSRFSKAPTHHLQSPPQQETYSVRSTPQPSLQEISSPYAFSLPAGNLLPPSPSPSYIHAHPPFSSPRALPSQKLTSSQASVQALSFLETYSLIQHHQHPSFPPPPGPAPFPALQLQTLRIQPLSPSRVEICSARLRACIHPPPLQETYSPSACTASQPSLRGKGVCWGDRNTYVSLAPPPAAAHSGPSGANLVLPFCTAPSPSPRDPLPSTPTHPLSPITHP